MEFNLIQRSVNNMVVIWRKDVDSRGTIKAIQDVDDNIFKSCIQCGDYKEIYEFKKNKNVKSHLLFEVLEYECLDCMAKHKDFPPLPEKNKSDVVINDAYHDFKKIFIEEKKRNEFEIWEFKVESKNYILIIKDKDNERFYNHPFTNMQGKDSTRLAAFNYFNNKYGAEFFSETEFMTICSYSNERDNPLSRRRYLMPEFIKFIPAIHQINLITIQNDLEALESEVNPQKFEPILEGKVLQYYGTKYERSPLNRQRALEIHGFDCKICGFNFEKVYGERGKDYIEVHHVKPLHTLKGEEKSFDSRTDLLPVCSNCHRMIHRNPHNVLTIGEMRSLVKVKSINKNHN